MTDACRACWRNCAMEADDEMSRIDGMEDLIAPIDSDATRVRVLISSLELCHHKAAQWVENIVEAIGAGKTDKGLGTRPPADRHAAETVWQEACAALSTWCAGRPSASIDSSIDTVLASQLLALLGERSPLKEWQVQRVIEKIRSLIHWPRPCEDPAAQYQWILISGGEYESFYRSECPEHYKEHERFWLQTVRTIIHDTENGDEAELSLALAIDMLWPCHWRFVENLQIVLAVIGGNLYPESPFTACSRNIHLVPSREKMKRISKTLRAFSSDEPVGEDVDSKMLALLGEPTPTKKWLAASLDKTIRLQLNPPDDLRAISALAGPDWIRH